MFPIYIFHSENPSSDMKRWGSDELSEGKDKSFQVDIVMKNSSASDSSVGREENGNLSATTTNKGNILREHVFSGISFLHFLLCAVSCDSLDFSS